MREEPKPLPEFPPTAPLNTSGPPSRPFYQRPVGQNESFPVPTQTENFSRSPYPYPMGQQFGYLGSQLSPQSRVVLSVLYPGLQGQADPSHAQYMSLFGQYVNPVPQPLLQQEKLPSLFKVPQEATNCLYIDGIPIDAKEREVARRIRVNRYFQTLPGILVCETYH